MSIQGRMIRQRERTLGMTDAERAWRAKWVKDQVLHNEPIMPENYYQERYNPIRRFYRAPMDKFESIMTKFMNPTKALVTRHVIAKLSMMIFAGYCTHYYFKYNASDWTRKNGWKYTPSRPALYPGDPGFPNYYEKKPHEYASFGFENSPL